MAGSQMQIGKQSEAARLVHDTGQPLQEALADLGTALQGDFEGFRGGAAAETVKAMEAWFDGARQVFAVLDAYSRKLVEVDRAEARTEVATQERFARLSSRLGGR